MSWKMAFLYLCESYCSGRLLCGPLKIIAVLGSNYESSVSTFTEEVRFGLLFAQNQKIILCMKTTKVFVKDVIWRLSS